MLLNIWDALGQFGGVCYVLRLSDYFVTFWDAFGHLETFWDVLRYKWTFLVVLGRFKTQRIH